MRLRVVFRTGPWKQGQVQGLQSSSWPSCGRAVHQNASVEYAAQWRQYSQIGRPGASVGLTNDGRPTERPRGGALRAPRARTGHGARRRGKGVYLRLAFDTAPNRREALERRRFLRLAALAPLTLPPVSAALAAAFSSALAARLPASPAGLGTRPALIALRAALRVEARQANDPWSICHAMLGIGPDLKLENGQVAADYLFTNFLKHEADGGPYFEVAGHGALMGEQHPFLVLKKCVELKLRPELWKPLADTGLRKLRMPATQGEWDDITWLLWAVVTQPGYAPDSRVGPDRVRLDAVALGALERVERADVAVEAALAAGGTLGFQRPSSGDAAARDSVWGFTCGGQHLLQTVIACQERGFLPTATRPRVEARLATLQQRLVGESNFRQAEKKKATAAGVDVTLVEHQSALALLKLNGHALETFGRARDAGFGDALALLAGAHGDADRLEQSQLAFQMRVPLGPYLASIRTKSAANWRLWLGDGCHALHGFGYWKELARRV